MSGLFLEAGLLDQLVEQARQSPRRRAHHNLHTNMADPAQRLLVAMEPDSYVRPHCHFDPAKAETLIILRGCLGVLVFDEVGWVVEFREMRPGGPVIGYDMPPGRFHSIVALEEGTVFMEAKAGPYVPLAEAEWAPWAPPEGAAEVPGFVAGMKFPFSG